LLVLDEPTANMDDAGARRIEEVVLELNARGATVLWINHDLEQVKRIARKVVVVDGGVPYFGPMSDMPQSVAESHAGVMV
jgi:zinc transport system ATP-binding protein